MEITENHNLPRRVAVLQPVGAPWLPPPRLILVGITPRPPSTTPRLCHPDGCLMSLPKEQVSPLPSVRSHGQARSPWCRCWPQNPAAKGDPTAPVPQVHTQLDGRAARPGFWGPQGFPQLWSRRQQFGGFQL